MQCPTGIQLADGALRLPVLLLQVVGRALLLPVLLLQLVRGALLRLLLLGIAIVWEEPLAEEMRVL